MSLLNTVRVFALKGLKPGSTSRVLMRYRVCLTRIVGAGGNAGAIQRPEWRIGLAGLISCTRQDAGTLVAGWKDRGERTVWK